MRRQVQNRVSGHEIDAIFDQLLSCASNGQRARLMKELVSLGVKTAVIAKRLDIADYQVRHFVRVARRLVPEVMQLLDNDKISMSLARAIASLPDAQQENAARNALAKRTSVSRFRAEVFVNSDQRLVTDLERLADTYSEQSGFALQIKPDRDNSNSGSWIIRYHSLDDFDELTRRFVGKQEYW